MGSYNVCIVRRHNIIMMPVFPWVDMQNQYVPGGSDIEKMSLKDLLEMERTQNIQNGFGETR